MEKDGDKTQKRHVFTMDLQSVLLAPRLQASALYYKTKLCMHNCTLFDLKTSEGSCFTWHEGEGGLSANEFCSLICKFVDDLETAAGNDVTLWSDGCAYQNRNATLANGLLSVVIWKKITIFQKYLVRGHTQMECDSMHRVIERKLAKHQINVPADNIGIFKHARVEPGPYNVKYIDHTFFKDYSVLNYYTSIRSGMNAGDPVVTDIVALCYTPDGVIKYKLNFDYEWALLPSPRSSRNRAVIDATSLAPLHSTSLPIKTEKFIHLQQLKHVLHKDYHPFYDNLKHICPAAGADHRDCPHIITDLCDQ